MDIFDSMIYLTSMKHGVDTFNNLMSINLKSNEEYNLDENVSLFYKMIREFNISPNSQTFSILFTLCAHCKKMSICLNLLTFLIKYCKESVELSNDLICS